jgi:hypothetical protein
MELMEMGGQRRKEYTSRPCANDYRVQLTDETVKLLDDPARKAYQSWLLISFSITKGSIGKAGNAVPAFSVKSPLCQHSSGHKKSNEERTLCF